MMDRLFMFSKYGFVFLFLCLFSQFASASGGSKHETFDASGCIKVHSSMNGQWCYGRYEFPSVADPRCLNHVAYIPHQLSSSQDIHWIPESVARGNSKWHQIKSTPYGVCEAWVTKVEVVD